MTRLSVCIPFPGFYHSNLSYAIDREEEYYFENCAADYPDQEYYWPEFLRLDAGEIGEILFRVTDYGAVHQAVARSYLSAFDYQAGQALGFKKRAIVTRHHWNAAKGTTEARKEKAWQDTLQLEFDEMTSPREYNFETDRLFATVPAYIMRRLFAKSRREGHETLAAVILRRFTSRSGFISHYPASLADWLAKPLVDWDCNELGTLLLAALEIEGMTESDIINEAEDVLTDGDGINQEWESGVNWDRFDSERMEARREKFKDATDDEARAWAANNQADFDSLAGSDPQFIDFATGAPLTFSLEQAQ